MTKPFKEAVEKGIVSGTSSALKGSSFASGFMNEYVSTLGSEYIGNYAKKLAESKNLSKESVIWIKHTASIAGGAIASAIETFIAELDNASEKTLGDIALEAAKSAAIEIISNIGSEYIGVAIDFADEVKIGTELLMEYDKNTGKTLKKFFDYLIIALSA